MTPRHATLGLLALVTFFCPVGLAAQEAAGGASTTQRTDAVAQLTQRMTQLSTQLQQVQNELAELKAARPTPGQPSDIAADAGGVTRAEFDALKTKVQAITDLIDSVDDQLASMARDAQEFADQVQQQNAVQEQMLAAISSTGAGGNPIPNLRAVMSDSRGRQILEEAVHQSLRRVGTVTIQNEMGQSYTMRVNGQTHVVPAGGITTVQDVPVGNVTTELVGYEDPKLLALTPPEYTLKILIKPGQPRVVQRVTTPVVYQYSTGYDPLLDWVVVP